MSEAEFGPNQRPFQFERTVTLGLLLTIVIQTAGALIWAGAAEARLSSLELQIALSPAVNERLARLEGRTAIMAQSLTRIEGKLMEHHDE